MKYVIVIISCFLTLNISAQKQTLSDKLMGRTYHDGLIVLNSGDTLKGKIVMSNDHSDYKLVEFVDTLTKEKKFYKPIDVQYFLVENLVFYSKKLNKKDVYMCLLVNDHLKLYLHKVLVATGYYSTTGITYVFEKPDGQMLQVFNNKLTGFSKKTGAFFSDYPELSEKIKNKTYKFNDVFIITKEYNTWLKSNRLE